MSVLSRVIKLKKVLDIIFILYYNSGRRINLLVVSTTIISGMVKLLLTTTALGNGKYNNVQMYIRNVYSMQLPLYN